MVPNKSRANQGEENVQKAVSYSPMDLAVLLRFFALAQRFLVTSVIPWCSAVAAIRPSGSDKGSFGQIVPQNSGDLFCNG